MGQGMGNDLRERRGRLRYSLKDVENELKIRQDYLDAIEQEDFAHLPLRVHTIGFVRCYASFLKLENTEEIVAYYKKALDDFYHVPASAGKACLSLSENKSKKKKKNRSFPLENEGFRFDKLLLGLVILLLLVWGGMFLYSWMGEKWGWYPLHQETAPPELVQIEPEVLPEPTVVPQETLLYVKLGVWQNMESWIAVVADGNEIFNGIKVGGEALEFTVQTDFTLHLGNAAAWQLLVNETDITNPAWQESQNLEFYYSVEDWKQRQNEANP